MPLVLVANKIGGRRTAFATTVPTREAGKLQHGLACVLGEVHDVKAHIQALVSWEIQKTKLKLSSPIHRRNPLGDCVTKAKAKTRAQRPTPETKK